MINYCTYIDIPKPPFGITYKDRFMFLGSCFADNIGGKLVDCRFNANVNPFGVLYNPLSVAMGCKRLLIPKPLVAEDLFHHDGMYHSFTHHGKFSDVSVENSLYKINESLVQAAKDFREISYLVITFGTAYVYLLKDNGAVVANCHKLPAARFERELLTVDRIVEEWSALLENIWSQNPSLKVILTVSPIRHRKDGAHFNQISKSTLLLAEQSLVDKYPDRISYFPAYELMMDELRDYRFYADDMIHPSKIAVDYIWERFCDTYMDAEIKKVLKDVEILNRALAHKPLNPSTDAYKHFLIQTMQKRKQLKDKYPYICIPEMENELQK